MELPSYFETETIIAGLQATDIFNLNSVLGASIESQVVQTLNRMRPVWDAEDKYTLYSFIRQSQTFPDVLLAKRKPNTNQIDRDSIVFGIELKGWYLLAKEREPSFRLEVTPAACADLDLIAIVPWFLTNLISGKPKAVAPYIESAKYAAEYRNYHWQHLMKKKPGVSTAIVSPIEGVKPYPPDKGKSSDKPESDPGGNFGRLARTEIMDEYTTAVMSEPIAGIEADYWLAFLKLFEQKANSEKIVGGINNLRKRISNKALQPEGIPNLAEEILALLEKHLIG
jgi:hypothetical protein